MNVIIFTDIFTSMTMVIATIIIARATVKYADISKRTLNGMKVYLKLMAKQSNIMQNQFISASHNLTESQKIDEYRKVLEITGEILKEIEKI